MSTLTTLNLHHLSISALLYVLGDRTLYLLNLRLVMWTSHTRLVDLLLQRLQPLCEFFDVSFAWPSLQWLSAESAIESTS